MAQSFNQLPPLALPEHAAPVAPAEAAKLGALAARAEGTPAFVTGEASERLVPIPGADIGSGAAYRQGPDHAAAGKIGSPDAFLALSEGIRNPIGAAYEADQAAGRLPRHES